MSISMCPTCDNQIDEDFDVEHYEICKEENEEYQKAFMKKFDEPLSHLNKCIEMVRSKK